MKKKILATLILLSTLFSSSVLNTAFAQVQPKKTSPSAHPMEGMNMGENMMGMMNMMDSCSRMMQRGMMGHMIPQLPAGNEKLQLQMHAEIMQKVGEIEAKYANQIKEEKK